MQLMPALPMSSVAGSPAEDPEHNTPQASHSNRSACVLLFEPVLGRRQQDLLTLGELLVQFCAKPTLLGSSLGHLLPPFGDRLVIAACPDQPA